MKKSCEAKELREKIRVLVRQLSILEKGDAFCDDVTLGQCHAIVEIGRAKEISLNDLAEVLRLDKSTMSRTVENLVNGGWVERNPDPKDRRYITICLTDIGVGKFTKIELVMGRYFEAMLEKIPSDRRVQVLESLGYLIQAIG